MDDKLIPTLVLPGDEEEAQQAAAEAEANEALSLSARVLSPSRPAAKRSRPTQSVRLHFFCPPRGSDPAFGICASLSCAS